MKRLLAVALLLFVAFASLVFTLENKQTGAVVRSSAEIGSFLSDSMDLSSEIEKFSSYERDFDALLDDMGNSINSGRHTENNSAIEGFALSAQQAKESSITSLARLFARLDSLDSKTAGLKGQVSGMPILSKDKARLENNLSSAEASLAEIRSYLSSINASLEDGDANETYGNESEFDDVGDWLNYSVAQAQSGNYSSARDALKQADILLYGIKLDAEDKDKEIKSVQDIIGNLMFCGNNEAEEGEECDGFEDAACPGACTIKCTCPPQLSRVYEPSRYNFFYDSAKAGVPLTISLDKEEYSVQSVTVVPSDDMENMQFTLDANISAPSLKPEGKVFQYFRLEIGNSSQLEKLVSVQVFFKVPHEWVSKNSIQSIGLQRAVKKGWERLHTEFLYADSENSYFRADMKNLSMFAVVGNVPRAATIVRAVCGNGLLEIGEDSETCCQDAGCPSNMTCVSNVCVRVARAKLSGGRFAFIVMLMIVAASFALYFYRKIVKAEKRTRRKHVTPERWF